jgi:glutathione transport system substrate-binding protein
MDVASFYNKLESHRADDATPVPFIAFGGWSSSTGDADWGLRPLLATAGFPPALSNFGFFSDKKVDDLIQAGLASADPKIRADAYAKAQDTVWQMAPWGYLSVDTLVAAKIKNLKGVYPMADGSFSVEDAELTD